MAAAGAADSIQVFDGADRPAPYAVASLFLLPSHSENFGLVIVEALAAHVPALVTDTTPWSGLAAEGCGWCVPWSGYPAALAAALALRPAEREAMGRPRPRVGRARILLDASRPPAHRILPTPPSWQPLTGPNRTRSRRSPWKSGCCFIAAR